MKSNIKFIVSACLISFFTVCVAATVSTNRSNDITADHKTKFQESLAKNLDGAYFNSDYVTEIFTDGDKDYIVYDNVDAGLDYVVIRVTSEFADSIVSAMDNNTVLSGDLVWGNFGYGLIVDEF